MEEICLYPLAQRSFPIGYGMLLGRLTLVEASHFTGDIMGTKMFSVPPCELSSKCGRRDCRHYMGVFRQKAM